MYADPSDIKKHRFNLSLNDSQKAAILSEAQEASMQPTSMLLELAMEGLAWRRHAANSSAPAGEMRRANA